MKTVQIHAFFCQHQVIKHTLKFLTTFTAFLTTSADNNFDRRTQFPVAGAQK